MSGRGERICEKKRSPRCSRREQGGTSDLRSSLQEQRTKILRKNGTSSPDHEGYHLHPIQDAILSTAYTGVHRVHTVHKKKEKLSIESIFSIVSTPVAYELHTKFN